ncbi:MAG: hypothetical protein ACRESX_06575 [Gammaproteobacteria bacterium]
MLFIKPKLSATDAGNMLITVITDSEECALESDALKNAFWRECKCIRVVATDFSVQATLRESPEKAAQVLRAFYAALFTYVAANPKWQQVQDVLPKRFLEHTQAIKAPLPPEASPFYNLSISFMKAFGEEEFNPEIGFLGTVAYGETVIAVASFLEKIKIT